jgi:hypothetical protein
LPRGFSKRAIHRSFWFCFGFNPKIWLENLPRYFKVFWAYARAHKSAMNFQIKTGLPPPTKIYGTLILETKWTGLSHHTHTHCWQVTTFLYLLHASLEREPCPCVTWMSQISPWTCHCFNSTWVLRAIFWKLSKYRS